MPKYQIYTYGCQMNYSDSERIEQYMKSLGYSKALSPKNADIVILNTCSIRQKAEDKVIGKIQKILKPIKKQRPNLLIGISGCMVRTSSSRYSTSRDKIFNQVDGLDIAIRTEELNRLASIIREIDPANKIPEIQEESLEDYFKIIPTYSSYKSKTQAFIPISNGCDKFCTYCIVPFSRGREKSRAISDIYDEAKPLVEKGVKEITLIGQTVNSYGKSNYDKSKGNFDYLKTKDPFVELLEKIDTLKDLGLERVRFTSSHPNDISDQLIDAMAKLKTQMPYLHLPIQSGDDAVLKRMNRPYTTKKYRTLIDKLRKKIPDISISTDLIVGFCGETDEEYKTTCEFFKDLKFEHAYHAQYSERKGTTASRFMKDDVPAKIKKQRWEDFNVILKECSKIAHQRFANRTVKVLVEQQKGKDCLGRSEHYKIVQFTSPKKILGKIVEVKITKPREWILEGKLMSK